MCRRDKKPNASASCTFGPDEYWEKLVSDTDYRKKCRMIPHCGTVLIKCVYEVDPLKCPTCGGKMKVISFIERHQTVVIEKILRHCGLWKSRCEIGTTRAPPRELPPTIQSSWITVDYDFFQSLAG